MSWLVNLIEYQNLIADESKLDINGNMPRPPGLPKTGGRKKGTPNARSIHLLEIFQRFNYDPAENILTLMEELPPKEQIDVSLHLMPYLYPKRAEPLWPYLEEKFGHSDIKQLTDEELIPIARESLKQLERRVAEKASRLLQND